MQLCFACAAKREYTIFLLYTYRGTRHFFIDHTPFLYITECRIVVIWIFHHSKHRIFLSAPIRYHELRFCTCSKRVRY